MSLSRKVRRKLTRPIRFDSVGEMQAFILANPAAYSIAVEHGPSCSPEVCRCTPTYRLQALNPENVQKGATAQAKWAKESVS